MKRLMFILLFLSLYSCKTTINTSINKCVEEEQMQLLKKSVVLFEAKLKNQYPELSKEVAYFEFISDWSNKKLPLSFYNDSLESKIRSLNLWTKSNRSMKDMNLEKKLFNVDSMNIIRTKLNEQFSKCIAMSTKVNGIRDFLLANSKFRYSPKLTRNNLFKVHPNELNEFQNRLVIVLGIYYQTVFNIKNTNR